MNRVLDIHREDAEARSFDELTDRITGIEIHRVLRPGLLESAYEEYLGQGVKRLVNKFSDFSVSPRLRG